jgi:hypothetical protein
MSSHRVKSRLDQKVRPEDLARVATTDLYDMLETNLRRMILAWEGRVPAWEQEGRARLCLAITKEVRARGIQMRLQF